jgi:hypothetical protein
MSGVGSREAYMSPAQLDLFDKARTISPSMNNAAKCHPWFSLSSHFKRASKLGPVGDRINPRHHGFSSGSALANVTVCSRARTTRAAHFNPSGHRNGDWSF